LAELLLLVEPHLGEPFYHKVTRDSLVMGRSATADLVVPDRYMSRLQARVFRDQGSWFVEDLGGRNPTLLNGRSVSGPSRVAPGDVISVSETRIMVQQQVRAESTAPSAGNTLFRPASALIAAREARARDLEREAGDTRDRTRWLRSLNEFYRQLAGPVRLQEVLELVLDRTFADLRPEEGVIFLRKTNGEYEQAAARRVPGSAGAFLCSRSLIAEVTEKGLAALVTDASIDERFAASESIVSSGIRSLVAAPLLDPEGCPGMIVLGSRAHLRSFTEDDMEELVSLAAAAALRIRNLALAEEAAQHRILEKELALARQIQVALLPDSLPSLPGFELYASSHPTRAVSGDLYQVQLRADGRECVLLVVDVSGKGMAASLLTASVDALAAGPIEVGQPPEEICSKVSRRLWARTSPERYATGFIAVLHPETGRFCYANAGHNAALLLRRTGEVEQLPATGLPLGLFPEGDYARVERWLGPGDVVLIYTDGITEAMDPDGEEYGLERLIDMSRQHAGRSVDELAGALDRDLAAFVRGVPFGDDRTLMILRRLP
jgi:sigma-B regulation protein RsbU (phosphoserine phosphatase)